MGACVSAAFTAGSTKRSAAMRADRPQRSDPAGPPCETPPGASWEPAAGASCAPRSRQPVLDSRTSACRVITQAAARAALMQRAQARRQQEAPASGNFRTASQVA